MTTVDRDELGYAPEQTAEIARMHTRPHPGGLVCGPTGNGRSTLRKTLAEILVRDKV